MPRPRASRLDRTIDRTLRGFARLGAVVVAALTVASRTRRGEETARALDTRLAQADRFVARQSAALDPLLTRFGALLDRVISRWLS
jgi:hypothetical protein